MVAFVSAALGAVIGLIAPVPFVARLDTQAGRQPVDTAPFASVGTMATTV
jgi:hypothetical protein